MNIGSSIQAKTEERWKPILLDEAKQFVAAVYIPRRGLRRWWPFPKRETWTVTLTFDLERDWPAEPVAVNVSAVKGEDVRIEWTPGSCLGSVSPPGSGSRTGDGKRALESIHASFTRRAADPRR
jgi:hypothetical protein